MLHSETPCVGSSRIRCTEAREAEGPPQSGRGESEFLPHRIASAVSVLYHTFQVLVCDACSESALRLSIVIINTRRSRSQKA